MICVLEFSKLEFLTILWNSKMLKHIKRQYYERNNLQCRTVHIYFRVKVEKFWINLCLFFYDFQVLIHYCRTYTHSPGTLSCKIDSLYLTERYIV